MATPTTSPLVRQPHEEKISYALSVLQVSVKNFGINGLVGINTVSEPFFRDFLNTFYGLHLRNLNDGIANYPAIDLGDKAARLCFQVSSDGTKKKLQKTLDTFGDPRHNLLQSYDKLRVMVIGKRQQKYGNLTIPHGVTFDPTRDVIDVPSLIAALSNVPTPTLISLSQVIDQEMPMFAAATQVGQHSDSEALNVYRSHFLRRALLDPWQQEGNVADFQDAVDSLLGLLTSGYVRGQPLTKPVRNIVDAQLKGGLERVYLKLVGLRQLFTHHVRLGDIDPATNFGNFQDPQICGAFDAYRQDVIDELNHVLSTVSLQPLPGVTKFP